MSNKQAEAAAARANALHAQVYGSNTDSDTEVVVDTSKAQGAEPVVNTDTHNEPVINEWETKFKVLQGKYNAEVPRLSREVRDKDGVIGTMRSKLDTFEKAPAVQPVVDTTSINPEDFADYGDEFQQLATMVTNLQNTVSALSTENTDLKNSVTDVENTYATVAQDDFYVRMDQGVPNWNDINSNPDFIAWLQELDSISGSTRQAHLDAAAAELNSTKAISIFKTFNDTLPVASNVPDERIARQVQPNSVRQSAPMEKQKRTYTRKEIKEFYKDIANGKWKGHEAELKQVEADLFVAPMEGRIIG